MIRLVIPVCLFLTGCAEFAQPTVSVTPDTFCVVAEPIYMSTRDRLTPSTEIAIIEHNERGQRLCGWKPPPKGS